MERVEYTQLSDGHMRVIPSKDTVSLLSLALTNTTTRTSQELDIDPTPRPLCIVKRRPVRTPHALPSFQLPSLSATGNSSSQRPSISAPIQIPCRRSSTAFPMSRNAAGEAMISDSSFGSGTQSHMSNSSFSTPIMSPFCGYPEGYEDLKVRKQRRKSKSHIKAEPVRGINDFYPPQFLSTSSDSEGLNCYSSNHKVSSKYTTPPSRIVSDSEDTPKAISTLNRDISVGAFFKAELVNPLATIDPSRTLLDQGAQSGNEGIACRSSDTDPERYKVSPGITDGCNAMQAVRLNGRPNVGLELPTKKKIFSRVLSGFSLLGRSNSIIGIHGGNVQMKPPSSVPLKQKRNDTIRSSSEMKTPSLKSISTTVSSYRPTLSESESINTASPRPSESGFTPMSSTDSHTASVPRHVGLCIASPQVAPLLQASLVITPEVESVDIEDSQSLWVAIEVAGELMVPSLNCGVPVPRKKGLDVVLLVDLSVNMSPATYVTSRDVCNSVVSLLDPYTDRLAILTSNASNSSQRKIYKAHVLFPLQPVNFKKALEAIDAMTRPNNDIASLGDNLNNAIKAAFNVFLSSNSPDLGRVDKDLPMEVYGHLFLISEDPPRKIRLPDRCEAVQLHLVNPSAVPWMHTREVNSGWKLDSSFSQSSSSANSCLRGGLLGSLKAIVDHARLGNFAGQLKDLVIDMKPTSDCELEAIMGETKHQKLSPGQRILVFAKLSVGPHPLLRPPATTFGPQEQGVQTSTRLLEQLDAILGQATTDILTVEVKYKHSLFSTETNISVTSTARLRRHTQQSPWNPQPDGQLPKSDNHQSHVQRHLGHFIASNHSPLHALSALEDMFSDTAALSACPAYFERLREELRHRIMISNRTGVLQNEVSLDGSPGLLPPFSHHKANSENPNTTTRAQYLGSTIINERLARMPSKESVDEARRIWVEMRKKARGRESVREYSDCIPVSDESLMKIAEKALSNKRSLGADTLKSIATGRRKSGLFAPWL